jgi:glycine/D-amino acid oxidase-like deaminating enzyme
MTERRTMRVVVIGAGVIGLSAATELARRGVAVTVVEQRSPGSGTSATTYGWVNSNNKKPRSYYELNVAGMEAHHRLARDAGGDWLVPSGHVEVATDDAHRRELSVRGERLRDFGYDAEPISPAKVRELVPGLRVGPESDSMYFPREAHCFPQLYLAFLLRRADELGVRILSGVRVEEFIDTAGAPALRLSDGSQLTTDRVVSCVGRWTAQLFRHTAVAVPMAEFEQAGDITVGYLAITNALPVSLTRLLTTSRLNVRPDGAGRLLLQALDLDSTADPGSVPSVRSDLALEFVARLQDVLTHTEAASIIDLRVGQRSIPADGLTVAGPLPTMPWLYVLATHSGVTLAPMLGASVAREIFGEPEPLLENFRPDRLLANGALTAPAPPRRPGQQ